MEFQLILYFESRAAYFFSFISYFYETVLYQLFSRNTLRRVSGTLDKLNQSYFPHFTQTSMVVLNAIDKEESMTFWTEEIVATTKVVDFLTWKVQTTVFMVLNFTSSEWKEILLFLYQSTS